IIGNKVSNTAGSGIYLAQNDGAIVRDNKISNSSQQQSDITLPSGGLALNECVGCTVENNLITTSGKDGIVVVAPLTNTTIQGNTVEFAKQWGIQLRGAVSDLNVYRNLVKNSVGGIDVVSTSAITRTKIQRNVIDTTFRDGIFVVSATNSDISHNHVKNYPATYFGIRVFSGASFSVRWNTVTNAVASGGIDLVGNNFQMSDNTVVVASPK
ncbi:MAG: hypothetical protein JWN45_2684, partial [Acidobacteriaceae bacterium]|nr:hypothetical protein [Acidobacteriaceae bacterium]